MIQNKQKYSHLIEMLEAIYLRAEKNVIDKMYLDIIYLIYV